MIRQYVVLLVLTLFFCVENNAQNIECIDNYIEISLTGYKTGNIQWQFSKDQITWTDIENQKSTSLNIQIQETGYFRAMVTNLNCTYYSDTTYIQAFPQPTIADAGEDQIFNDGTITTTLSANTPETGHGTGQWSILSGEGGSFDDSSDPHTKFFGILRGAYYLRWTISTSCQISEDDVMIVFAQDGSGGQIADIDGNTYNTIWIGSQKWMAENLKTTKYNDISSIPNILNNSEWGELSTGAYCWYNNDHASYAHIYGALYNWFAIESGKLCPSGWHVPSDAEWTILTDYLGGIEIAGGKLKETGTMHWKEPNTGATNEAGFSALPGGHRLPIGQFNNICSNGFWWSATEDDSTYGAIDRVMGYYYNQVYRSSSYKQWGYSVRCLSD